MNKQAFLSGLALVLFLGSTALGQAAAPEHESDSSLLAATPPMGWNSWDGYGTTVKEADVKANAQWLAEHLKPFGWQYVVVDMEWFVTNPTPEGNSKTSQYSMDDFGRYTPAVNRFPSAANGAGFKPLGGLCPFARPEVRHPYSAGHSQTGGGEESSDLGVVLSCRGCRGHLRHLSRGTSITTASMLRSRERKPTTIRLRSSMPVGTWT